NLPLVMGPNHQNFRETCTDLIAHEALLVGANTTETNSLLLKLAREASLRQTMTSCCQAWMKKQGTPSEFTL